MMGDTGTGKSTMATAFGFPGSIEAVKITVPGDGDDSDETRTVLQVSEAFKEQIEKAGEELFKIGHSK